MKTVIQLIAETCRDLKRLKLESMFANETDAREVALLTRSITLRVLEGEFLPSGAGFDQGTTIDNPSSDTGRIILNTAYHHMDEHGSYIRWSYHDVHVLPDFSSDGFRLLVKGKDYRGIKEYIHEVFTYALATEIPDDDIKAIISQSKNQALLAVERTKDHAKP